MINRELIKENNSLVNTERTFSFKKVEQLLEINEKLRVLLEKSRAQKQDTPFGVDIFPKSSKPNSANQSFLTSKVATATASREETIRNEFLEQIDSLKLQVSMLQKENSKYKTQLEAAKATDSQIQTLRNKLKELETHNQQLESEVKSAGAEINRLKSVSIAHTSQDDEVPKLKEELAEISEELHKYREYIPPLLAKMEELQRDKEILEKAIDERSQENEMLQKKVDSLEPLAKENKILKQRYFLVRTASEMFRNRIEEQNVLIEKMQKMINTDEILDVEIDIRKIMAERNVLAAQNERIKKPITEKILKLDMLKLKVSTEIEEFENLKRSIRQLDDSVVLARDSGHDFTKARDSLVKTLELRKSTMKDFQTALQDVDTIKEQLNDMHKELKEVKSEMNTEQDPHSSHSYDDGQKWF